MDEAVKIKVSGTIRGSDGDAYIQVRCGTSATVSKIPLVLVPASTEYLLTDLTWYLEEYIKQPFETGRASQATENIKIYATTLIALILEDISDPESLRGSRVIVEVSDHWQGTILPEALHGGPRVMPLLHWECLEAVKLWPQQFKPQTIAVVRMTPASIHDGSGPQQQPRNLHRGLCVLATSARPAGERDIPHRLISRTIARVVEGLQEKPNPPELVIARPGSLSGLEHCLSAYNRGYFDIVHLDVHGIASEEMAILCFTNDSDTTQVHQVNTQELAEILRIYEVQCVIINACQSASGINNFTRSLVQHGIRTVLGMQYNLLESAAEIFTAALYEDILSRHRPIPDACSYARAALRNFSSRRTDYNTTITITDYLNPVLYTSECFTTLAPRSPDDFAMGAVGLEVDESLLGRESTILDLENSLSTFSNRIYLRGSPGSGKSALVRHLSTWWKATGFIQGTLLIDFATIESTHWTDVCHSLCLQAGLPSGDETKLSQFLIQNRYQIIFDSLDAVDEATTTKIRKGMSKFAKSIKRTERYKSPSVIVCIGRQEVDWIRSFTGSTYDLNGLDLSPSMKMCFGLLNRLSRPLNATDMTTARYMEQIIALVGGNPLALELLMADISTRKENLSEYYFRLTSNKRFGLDKIATLNLQDNRTLKQALSLRQTSWDHDLITSIRYLSPFWKVVPVKLSSYWKFLKFCIDRVAKLPATLDSRRNFEEQKEAAESMDKLERQILFNKEKYRGDFDQGELDDIDLAFVALLDDLCKSGYLSTPATVMFGASLGEDYFIIHPILTLCLRTSPDVDTTSTDRVVIPVAFQRYYARRDKKWPKDIPHWSPGWTAPSEQVAFEFENYVTYLNFMFTIEPTMWTLVSLEPKVAFLLGRRHGRTVIVALGIINRGVEHFLKHFRMKRPTIVTRIAGRMVKLAAMTCVKVLKGIHAPTDEIGDPYRTEYVVIGMYCCVFTMAATMASVDLGIKTLRYRDVANELSEGYIDGTMFSHDFKSFLASLGQLFDTLDKNSLDWTDVRASVGKITGADLVSPFTGEHGEENMEALRAMTGRMEWEYQIGVMNEKAAEYFSSSTVSAEEVATLEKQLHQVLRDNMREIQSPWIPVHTYKNLVLLAMRRCDFALALEHCRSAQLYLARLPMEAPWIEARDFCDEHCREILMILGKES